MGTQIERLGEWACNTYLLWQDGATQGVLVDPGSAAGAIGRALEARGLSVAAILLTHGHFDHIGAVDTLRGGAPVYIHAGDAAMLTDPAGNLSTLTGRSFAVRAADGRLAGGPLTVAGITLEVLHTPGHTPGSVCLRCGGTLLSGDTLFARGYGRTDLPGGDADAIRASIGRLLALDGALRVLPGHGGGTTIAEERQNYGL